MLNLSELSNFQYAGLSIGYIVIRAAFFYTLFTYLYKKMKQKRGICKDLPSAEQLKQEKISNLKANLFEMIFIALVMITGVMKFHDFTWLRFWGSFFFVYFFFEFWFYTSHRLMHVNKFKTLKKFHKTHHVSVITTPLSALTLSLGEKAINDLGMLIIPCLVSHFIPMSFEGIMAYHLYNFYINVLGHSNLELMPRWFEKSPIGKIYTTATYHSIHHLKGHYNFGLFTTLFDRLFGTYDPTYSETFEQVINANSQTRKEVILRGKVQAKLS